MSIWAFCVPIFESPDEPLHWANAQYIHSHGSLPPYNSDYLEGNQSPLYYILVSPFASTMAKPAGLVHLMSDKPVLSCPPRFYADCPGDSSRYWPVRRARFASILIGLLGVAFTGLCAFEVSGSIWTASLAAALIGFLPQFDFRAASINNDVAGASFSAMALYFIARLVIRPYSLRAGVGAAVGVAFAFLSKINAAVVLPVFIVGILLSSGDLGQRLRRLWLLLISFALVFPWVARNRGLYGDFLGLAAMPGTVPMMVGRRAITDPYFTNSLPSVAWRSLIGYFGWMNILSPDFVYTFYLVLCSIALIGLLLWLARNAGRRWFVLLLATVPVMSVILFVYFNMTIPQPQGRLLFPCLSALAVIFALGFSVVSKLSKPIALLLLVACASVNAYTLRKVIYPAYWLPAAHSILPDVSVSDTLTTGGALGPLEQGHVFTQSFVAEHDNLAAVDLEVAGYTKTMAHGNLQLAISEQSGGFPLGLILIPASTVPGCCIYAHLDFPPLQHSAGKKYFISLDTKGITLPDAVTVFLSPGDVYKDGEAFVDKHPLGKDTSFRTFYSAPLFCGTCPAATP